MNATAAGASGKLMELPEPPHRCISVVHEPEEVAQRF